MIQVEKDYYIVTWELREEIRYPWKAKACMYESVDSVLNSVRHMELGKEKGRVDNVVIRKFSPRTGEMVAVEPFLDGWDVGLREIVPAEPKTQLQMQRGE